MRRLVLITLSFGLLGAAQPAGAVVAYMHEFSLIKNGNQTFLDTFDDGLEPPSAPDYTPAGGGGPASYGIGAGTYQSDAESGGRLRMNSLDGDTVVNASGFANSSLFAVLLTNADPTNTINGLKSNHTFSITGTFGLVTNGGPLYSGYGIGFNDAGGGLARRNEVNLQVQYSMGLGMEIIRLSYQDFDAATVTTVAYIPLAAPAGTDEIALTLSRADLATTDLVGTYAFLDNGAVVDSGTIGTTSLFQDRTWVRGLFFAASVQPAPEPGTLALISLGLAGLAAARRRKQ